MSTPLHLQVLQRYQQPNVRLLVLQHVPARADVYPRTYSSRVLRQDRNSSQSTARMKSPGVILPRCVLWQIYADDAVYVLYVVYVKYVHYPFHAFYVQYVFIYLCKLCKLCSLSIHLLIDCQFHEGQSHKGDLYLLHWISPFDRQTVLEPAFHQRRAS